MIKANQSEFLKEARRCAYEASKGVSPGRSQMFSGLALFYSSLAESEPQPERRVPKHRAGMERRPGKDENAKAG